MKTLLTTLAILITTTFGTVSSLAQPYTYVFIPQTNPSLPDFDHDLAAATITLNNDLGFFNSIMVNFTPYAGVQHDPLQLTLSGEVTPGSLSMLSGGITTTSKTYFTNHEQILTDAEHDGTWVMSSSVPEAGATLPLFILSLAALGLLHRLRRGTWLPEGHFPPKIRLSHSVNSS